MQGLVRGEARVGPNSWGASRALALEALFGMLCGSLWGSFFGRLGWEVGFVLFALLSPGGVILMLPWLAPAARQQGSGPGPVGSGRGPVGVGGRTGRVGVGGDAWGGARVRRGRANPPILFPRRVPLPMHLSRAAPTANAGGISLFIC